MLDACFSTVAHFSVSKLSLLSPEGTLHPQAPSRYCDRDFARELLKKILRLRTFDQKAVRLQRTGKMGTYASTLGQEAVGVALGMAMQACDVLCPAYREYGAMLERGVRMEDIFLYWGGDERGSCYPHQPEDLPICVPIATQALHAAGVAQAFRLRQQPRVAVSVCGDGATSKGDFYEAMNVAGIWNLPVVFVVNNNQWAISVPRTQQTHAATLAQKAIAAGIAGIQVDGNDALALLAAFERALEQARSGHGPTLVEALTYRLCDHTTADDGLRYRPKTEIDEAWKHEPVLRLKRYLQALGAWSDEEEAQWLAECQADVERAVEAYLHTQAPDPQAMLEHLYASLPDALLPQYLELKERAHHD